jgi:hypothetical protein
MNAIEYIQRQLAGMRRLCDAPLQGLTDEQFNWCPPGLTNPISAILVHALTAEDRFVQQVLQGKPRIWETEGWAEKIGLPIPPGGGRGWDEVRGAALSLAPVLQYQQAVRTATDAYLATLTPADLDRSVTLFNGERPAAEVFALLVTHSTGHAGEIAALKGVQGVKGLPF